MMINRLNRRKAGKLLAHRNGTYHYPPSREREERVCHGAVIRQYLPNQGR